MTFPPATARFALPLPGASTCSTKHLLGCACSWNALGSNPCLEWNSCCATIKAASLLSGITT